MSIYIGGWVEVKAKWKENHWEGIIRVDEFLHGHYDMFGCLFDVANYTGLNAPAPKRGLPQDISLEGLFYNEEHEKEDGTDGTLWQSWITWAEIKAVDLDEVGVDRRAHKYKRAEDGLLVYQNSKSSAPNTPAEVYEGLTWEDNGTVYRIQTITRREFFEMSSDWQMLFDMMRILEKRYSSENIRLVAWFW
jgi:hypothetical protein